jgi:hypothetical protein
LLAILLSLPFLVLFLVVLFFSKISLLVFIWYVSVNPFITLLQYPLLFLSLFIYILSLLFWISYYKVTLVNLNLKYVDWEKISYMKNIYFDFWKIYKYFIMVLWMILYISIPIIIFFFLFFLFFFLFWLVLMDKNWIVNNYFSSISLLLFVMSFLFSLYILYRVSFSYILLCDDTAENKAKYYVLKSTELTKWFYTFVKFVSVMVVFLIPIVPFTIIWNNLEKKSSDISYYIQNRNSNTASWKLDDYRYQNLDLQYGDKTDNKLNLELKENRNLNILYYIFSFLFVYWFLEMARVSFYKNEFAEKSENIFFEKLSLLRNFLFWIFKKKEKIINTDIEEKTI